MDTRRLARLDAIEEEGIATLRSHPVLTRLQALAQPQLQDLLVQRSLVARAFTPLYDLALMGVGDSRLERALVWLMREEYPAPAQKGSGPNHRKALAMDLERLGVSRERMLNATASAHTSGIIDDLHGLLRYGPQDTATTYDVRIASALKGAMETAVSVEYGRMLEELVRPERGTLTEGNSVFYVPHRDHDRKTAPLHRRPGRGEGNHSNVLAATLQRLVVDDATEAVAAQTLRAAYATKARFYDQFIP